MWNFVIYSQTDRSKFNDIINYCILTLFMISMPFWWKFSPFWPKKLCSSSKYWLSYAFSSLAIFRIITKYKFCLVIFLQNLKNKNKFIFHSSTLIYTLFKIYENYLDFLIFSVMCKFILEPNAKVAGQHFLKAAVMGVVVPAEVEVSYWALTSQLNFLLIFSIYLFCQFINVENLSVLSIY